MNSNTQKELVDVLKDTGETIATYKTHEEALEIVKDFPVNRVYFVPSRDPESDIGEYEVVPNQYLGRVKKASKIG
jgi:hypothetical protein